MTTADERLQAVRDGLPRVKKVDRNEVAKRYVAARRRAVVNRGRSWWGFLGTVTTASGLSLISTIMARRVIGLRADVSHAAVATTAVIFSAVMLALGATLLVSSRHWSPDLRMYDLEMGRRQGIPATRLIIVLLTAFAAYQPLEAAFFGLSIDTVAGRERLLALVAALGIASVIAVPATRSQKRTVGQLAPLDVAAVQLVTVALYVQKYATSKDRVDYRSVRRAVAGLERAAVAAETFSVRQIPLWDRQARRETRREGLRLAAAIRANKTELARASGASFANVARWLTVWLGHWSKEHVHKLLDDAPEVTLSTRPRTVIWLVVWAAVLVGFSFLLPLFPPLRNSPAAVSSAQISIWFSALMTVATGTLPISEHAKPARDTALSTIDTTLTKAQ